MPQLKRFLSGLGQEPADWEIYRGDEFQVRLPYPIALEKAIALKALVRSWPGMDVRIGLGLGEEEYRADRIAESNGPAYHYSGRVFGTLREQKLRMQVASHCHMADRSLNLLLKFALHIMDQWSQVSAEIVALALDAPEASQKELAEGLGIRQSAVSQRMSRARLDLILELLEYYRKDYLKYLEACS